MDASTTQTIVPPPGETGLTIEEARARLAAVGPNQVVPRERRGGVLGWTLHALTDPMAVLLIVASVTYLLLRDFLDAAVTLAALAPITAVSLVLEVRAERTLEQLRKLTAPTATVWRDGRRQTVAAEELVPGDLVFVTEGDIVPVDGVLVAGAGLMVDESALTGESQPVAKDAPGTASETDAALYAGTTLLSGRGIARATETGARTRYGQIGRLVAEIQQSQTPLQRTIRRLIVRLGIVAVLVSVGVVAIELARGNPWGAAVIAGVSLAIAAIPEEFPVVYTLYLTLGARRLARDKALVRRLPGVETLGATTVICTDKTGTLTVGHIEVAALYSPRGEAPSLTDGRAAAGDLLRAAVLASEPDPFDPLEQAIVRYAAAQGVDVDALHRLHLAKDYPFDPVDKYVTHVWRVDGALSVYAKGAIEGILARSTASDEDRRRVMEANERFASEGMRLIAVASGPAAGPDADRAADERGMALQGLIAFSDPVRPGVPESLAACRAAGVQVVMMTGDHPVTAAAVAASLGLARPGDRVVTGDELDGMDDGELAATMAEADVFARMRPEQKHRLVRALRSRGELVAMTGDGINDAPALREADIGVAMGQRGTEVAREAATIVLLDDNFATIVAAVRDGRRIFDNLRRAFSYLIAFHMPLLLGALVVPLTGSPLLLLPVHLVLLELVVHPTSSLVFEADPPSPELMQRGPRQAREGLLSFRDLMRTLTEGLALFAGVLSVYLVRLVQDVPEDGARAMAFATMVLGQTLLVLIERSPSRPLWRTGLQGNKALLPVIGATLAGLLLIVHLPPLAQVVRFAPLSPGEWAVALLVAAAATLWMEPVKAWRSRGKRNGNSPRLP